MEPVQVVVEIPETVLKQVFDYQQVQGIPSVSAAVVAILGEFFAQGDRLIPCPLPSADGLLEEIEDEPDEILYDFLDFDTESSSDKRPLEERDEF